MYFNFAELTMISFLENMLRYLLIEDRIIELELVNTLGELILANETENDNNNDFHRINQVDLTEHFFKKFKKFKNVILVFYSNILTDLKDIRFYESYFDRFFWFLFC